jgi:hypothetical protein
MDWGDATWGVRKRSSTVAVHRSGSEVAPAGDLSAWGSGHSDEHWGAAGNDVVVEPGARSSGRSTECGGRLRGHLGPADWPRQIGPGRRQDRFNQTTWSDHRGAAATPSLSQTVRRGQHKVQGDQAPSAWC